jgi:hypothetical protein
MNYFVSKGSLGEQFASKLCNNEQIPVPSNRKDWVYLTPDMHLEMQPLTNTARTCQRSKTVFRLQPHISVEIQIAHLTSK